MSVTGVGIYPQIFFDLPQIIDTDKYPPELGYEALRSLFMEFIVDVKDHFLKIYMYQYIITQNDYIYVREIIHHPKKIKII